MKTAMRKIWKVQYKDGLVVTQPWCSRDEILFHCSRCDGTLLGEATETFEYPEEQEIIIDLLTSMEFEPTDELISASVKALDEGGPMQLRRILMARQ